MLSFLRNIAVILSLFCSNEAFSLNSSSYLVANSAIKLFDFDKARKQYSKFGDDLNEVNLHNQLLTYINLNLLNEANLVAQKIISLNNLNQEAWTIYLTNAVIKKDLNAINKFKKNNDLSQLELLNYIFFSEKGELKDSNLISKSIFEVVQASLFENKDQINYQYLLFYLSVSIVIDPDFMESYFYLAQIYQNLKRYSKAEYYYKQIMKGHALYVQSQNNIAINKSRLGFYNEGVELLEKILIDNKKDIDLIGALADLHRTNKHYEEAIKYYSKIINLDNNLYNEYWRIYYLRGICFERLKKWDLAEKDFLFSLKIKPNSPQVLNYLAYGWLERNLYLDRATKMLKRAYQENPESHYITDSLAWAYFKKNELKKAADLMEKVIIMAPGETISLDHLGDIYYAMNRKREAYYLWQQALDLTELDDEAEEKLIKKIADYNE